MWWHRRDHTPKSSRTFPPVATHGLIGKRKSGMADRSKSGNDRRDLRTHAGLPRNEPVTMKARSATLAHRLDLALAEWTHAALARRTPIYAIIQQLSRNPVTHDLPCPKTSRSEIVCDPGSRDEAIFRIIPAECISVPQPIVEWWHRRDQAPIPRRTLSPVATHGLLACDWVGFILAECNFQVSHIVTLMNDK